MQLLKRFNKLNKLNIKQNFFVSGYGNIGDNQHENNIPTVNSKLIWLTIQNTRGYFERISGFEGETLMQCLLRHQVDYVPGSCQGGEDLLSPITVKPVDFTANGPFCSACVVYIGQGWREQMGKMHQLEEQCLLNSTQQLNYQARLSCCIVLEKWMDEMFVKVGTNYIDDVIENVQM